MQSLHEHFRHVQVKLKPQRVQGTYGALQYQALGIAAPVYSSQFQLLQQARLNSRHLPQYAEQRLSTFVMRKLLSKSLTKIC